MIISDSYMGVFLPSDLPGRILEFINSKVDLPIVIRTELMACFYLFGKNQGVQVRATSHQDGLTGKKKVHRDERPHISDPRAGT